MKKLLIFTLAAVLLLVCTGCFKEKTTCSENAGAWESISGSFTREDSSQYNNGVLQIKYLSNNCAMFEFRLMEGSESEDMAENLVLPFVLLVGEDGVGRYESLPDSEKPFSIDFALSEDGQTVTVTHTGELSISPDGVYTFTDSGLEVSEVSAIAILEHLATAATSLNHNNGEYIIQYPEELLGEWFYPVQAVFKDSGAVLAKFLIAKDLSAVYRADDDIEPVLIFGTAQPLLDAEIISLREDEGTEGENVAYSDEPVPLVEVALKDGVSLAVGQESPLIAGMPWKLPYTLTAESSDSTIAQVDEKGMVKGIAVGEATIKGIIELDDGKKEFSIDISVGEVEIDET